MPGAPPGKADPSPPFADTANGFGMTPAGLGSGWSPLRKLLTRELKTRDPALVCS
jgi:hypothetical protein